MPPAPRPPAPRAAAQAGVPHWPHPRTRAWVCHYLAWDGATSRSAVIVLPSGLDATSAKQPLPLVISPHGRNNFAWSNASTYWQDLPADGPFALVCPDGLGRAHDAASDPFNQPPLDPTLFTYGYARHIRDLARMPSIVRAVLPWLKIDMKRIYVLGSSMGGQETLLLAAGYPRALVGGTGRLAGAAAFDSACDLVTQCGYLTRRPVTQGGSPPDVAARMIQEIGTRPAGTANWNKTARFYDSKLGRQQTIGELLRKLPAGQAAWDERSPLAHAAQLAALPFPLRLYWSTRDVVVGNQETDQSGKLYSRITALNPDSAVEAVRGQWAHSTEFVPGRQLSEALRAFRLIA